MSNRYLLLETSPFSEFSSTIKNKNFDDNFDIDIELTPDLHSYCQQLVYKTFAITHSQIPDFINHHCSLAKNPLHWLNKYEKLIHVNEELFHGARNESRMVKLYTCIEFKRKEFSPDGTKKSPDRPSEKQINAVSEDRYFCFKETKKKAELMSDDKEKIYYLTSEIFEYRGADIDMRNDKLLSFDTECEKLITKIQTLSKLRNEMEGEKLKLKDSLSNYSKIKINCQINQFIDIFYQLNRELFWEGKNLIEGSINDIAIIISNSFVDKDGNEISPETVKTIFRPSKQDKRPKPHKRIDIDKLL